MKHGAEFAARHVADTAEAVIWINTGNLTTADVCSALKMQVPSSPLVVGALRRLGYACSQVHCEGNGLKTNAPALILFGVLRTYKVEKYEDLSMPENIKAPVLQGLDFSYDAAHDLRSGNTGVVKFPINAPNWGPKARHCGAAPPAEK
jgi:tRNA (guanine26-N2/guanine27-N2)-dimethyltransferase